MIGSPPPMRGKVSLNLDPNKIAGITPAYAGKRKFHGSRLCITWDHPRLCGEKLYPEKISSLCLGSPPPMRGKVRQSPQFYFSQRITPAYAGKSRRASFQAAVLADHPRLCGEKTKKIPKQRYFFHQPASFSFSLQYT